MRTRITQRFNTTVLRYQCCLAVLWRKHFQNYPVPHYYRPTLYRRNLVTKTGHLTPYGKLIVECYHNRFVNMEVEKRVMSESQKEKLRKAREASKVKA